MERVTHTLIEQITLRDNFPRTYKFNVACNLKMQRMWDRVSRHLLKPEVFEDVQMELILGQVSN